MMIVVKIFWFFSLVAISAMIQPKRQEKTNTKNPRTKIPRIHKIMLKMEGCPAIK